MCGCSSSTSTASIFPPRTIPAECLSSIPSYIMYHPISDLRPIFSQSIGSLKFTCNTDFDESPRQDCLNTLAHLCNPSYLWNDEERISNCKNAVDTIFNGLNSYWQAVRSACGQWPYAGYTGNLSSSNCTSANAALREFYSGDSPFKSYSTFQLTESLSLGLWTNQALRG